MENLNKFFIFVIILLMKKDKFLLILLSIFAYVFFHVLSHIGFKMSVQNRNLKNFIYWQVIGNLSGFLSVLSYTYLLTLLPLHLGYAITIGLGQIFVQVFAAKILFKEEIMPIQWLGISLIILGTLFLVKGKAH